MVAGYAAAVGPVATIVWWGGIWLKVEHSIRTIPTLRFGEKLALAQPPSGRVCVVIPTHNASALVVDLIRSLRAETYPDLRVVLALDRCTDDTLALAREQIASDARFEIIEIDSCPDNWSGKTHAVHAALKRSQAAIDAEYLLFADADTLFS